MHYLFTTTKVMDGFVIFITQKAVKKKKRKKNDYFFQARQSIGKNNSVLLFCGCFPYKSDKYRFMKSFSFWAALNN